MSGKETAITLRTSAHLDIIRGVAALAVMVGHIRGLFFVDYPQLKAPSLFISVLYAITGLGHQAVLVFFVLSGFFIGGGVLAALPRWSWKRYLVNRFSRLYLVLIPALALTAILDYFAYRQPGGHTFFDFPIAHFNPFPLAGRDSIRVFLGNTLFLQNIVVPTFGSDSPLWSLANEFWYYLLFPALALTAFSCGSLKGRAGVLVMALALLAWLPAGILGGFPVWLLGVAVYAMPTLVPRPSLRWTLQAGTAGIFGGTLMFSRVGRIPAAWGDFAVGLAFALWLYCIVKIKVSDSNVWPPYELSAKTLSKCSYSVYAVHFPVVLLVRTSLGSSVWAPTFGTLAIGLAGSIATFCFGLLFSQLTEAQTHTVRVRLLKLLSATAPVGQGVARTLSKSL